MSQPIPKKAISGKPGSPQLGMRLVVAVPAPARGLGLIRPLELPGPLDVPVAKHHVGPATVTPARQDAERIGAAGGGFGQQQGSGPMLIVVAGGGPRSEEHTPEL